MLLTRYLSPSKQGKIRSQQGLVVTNIDLEFRFEGVCQWENALGLCLQRLALAARQLRA